MTRRAGGRATEAGMAFQAGVGSWFAAHLVAGTPCGPTFGLRDDAVPSTIQFETGAGMDDVEVHLDPGGVVALQCKTNPNMSPAPGSDFAQVVHQLVRFSMTVASEGADASAVMAIGTDAPARWSSLERACRAFDGGGAWDAVVETLSGERRASLDAFALHVAAAWPGGGPGPADLARLARLLRIVRFDVAEGGREFREAAGVLGRGILGEGVDGTAAMRDLVAICRGLVERGAPATRAGLLARLRALGHVDVRAGRHERDVRRLREHTAGELERLGGHRALTVGGPAIERARCGAALAGAAAGGGVLVAGDPGSGKTGVLLGLAATRVAAGAPTVLLAVGRHTGAATARALWDDLGLDGPLVDALAHWPGAERGVLLIDALDECREGSSDAVFAVLIEEAARLVGDRWSVVASIRTFDLLAGGRRRLSFAGPPVDLAFVDPRLARYRHLMVPSLDREDLEAARAGVPALGELLDRAPAAFLGLLGNAFNLSLAADLVERGLDAEDVGSASTQSELISRYEDARIVGTGSRRAVAAVVRAIVERRSLSVREVDVEHDGVAGLLAAGVLTRTGDRVGFAHAILFDHAAGRFHLDDADPGRLLAQLSGAPRGLLLGPALRFALERMWHGGGPGRRDAWRFARLLASRWGHDAAPDPIVSSVALRALVERAAAPADVAGLVEHLRTAAGTPDEHGAASLLSRLSRFATLAFEAHPPTTEAARAWEDVAEAAVLTGAAAFGDGARILLHLLRETPGFRPGAGYGRAARGLLAAAREAPGGGWGSAAGAIPVVGSSHATDPSASRELLEAVLDEPRFALHAHEEAAPLAEAAAHIAACDPDFAVRIHRVLFGTRAPTSGPVPMGRSRILAFGSTREQDYEMARYGLRRGLPALLDASPATGLRAVAAACLGGIELDGRRRGVPLAVPFPGSRTVVIPFPDASTARVLGRDDDNADDRDPLASLGGFLAAAPASRFREVIDAAAMTETVGSVWARILEAATARPGLVDDELWPLASSWDVVRAEATSKQAVDFLAAAYPTRRHDERRALEDAALAAAGTSARDRAAVARLASELPDAHVATPGFGRLATELRESGDAKGNPWPIEIGTGWLPVGVEDLLALDGDGGLAEAEDGALVAAIRELDRALSAASRGDGSPPAAMGLREATDAAMTVIRTRDGVSSTAWSYVGLAVLLLAEAAVGTVGPGGTEPAALAALVIEVSSPTLPVAVRAYGCEAAIALVGSVPGPTRDALLGRASSAVADVDVAVRSRAVGRLRTLRRDAPTEFWAMLERLADVETDVGVLATLVGRVLVPLARLDAGAVEALAARVMARVDGTLEPVGGDRGGREVDGALGMLACILAVDADSAAAAEWIGAWLTDAPRRSRRLSRVAFALRDALFLKYRPGATPARQATWERATRLFASMAAAAATDMRRLGPSLRRDADDAGRADALARFAAADELLRQCCEQLYHGSGAFQPDVRGTPAAPALADDARKRTFLSDFRGPLDAMTSGMPATIHSLVRTYAFLADAAPAEVFDAVAGIVTGPGSGGGYHLERLAMDEIARFVGRYLADHRGVLDDEERRGRLVGMLDLFAGTGWPDASRMLHDLPDLLR